jgi:hypothetical protein
MGAREASSGVIIDLPQNCGTNVKNWRGRPIHINHGAEPEGNIRI